MSGGTGTTDPSWTVGKLLDWTTGFFAKQQGGDRKGAKLDAEILLAHVLSCPRIQLYMKFNDAVPEGERAAYRELVKKRSAGCPVAYLVGKQDFYTLTFRVTPDVLIPRPETEFVVGEAVAFARGRLGVVKQKVNVSGGSPEVVADENAPTPAGAALRLADVGVGSGAILISVLRELNLPGVTGVGLDKSPAALAVARGNAETLGVADRATLVESDLFAALPPGELFDLIVSNPPYVSDAEYEKLPRDVKDFEPRAAMAAGPDGLAVLRPLVREAAGRLRPGGRLVVEISATHEAAARGLFDPAAGWALRPTVRDAAGLPRVLVADRPA